jgi:uncharacterized membrane protein
LTVAAANGLKGFQVHAAIKRRHHGRARAPFSENHGQCFRADRNMNYLPCMKLRWVACWVLAILFFGAGIAHFFSIQGMARFLPDWVPMKAAGVVFTGILEVAIAVGLSLPSSRKWSGRLAFALLVLYTPLHLMDVMREAPVIGSKMVAIIRLPVQFVLLYLAWRVGWSRR